jgi:hypothetical protein
MEFSGLNRKKKGKSRKGFNWKQVLEEMYNSVIASPFVFLAMGSPLYKMNLKTIPLSSPGFWTDS